MNYFESLMVLLFLHALADFAFQSDAMARGKNRNTEEKQRIIWINELKRDPAKFKKCWFYWLSAHGLIQGGLIFIMFGNIWIFMIEVVSHVIVDFIKCEEKISPHHDQAIHVGLKFIYAIILVI